MFDLLNNASFLVYIWSIYEGIEHFISVVAFLLVVFSSIFTVFSIMWGIIGGDDMGVMEAFAKFPKKTLYSFAVLFLVLSTLLPKKEYLPYIISASPVAKTIVSSYEDGKLQKVDAILDKSLDKALKYLEDNTSK